MATNTLITHDMIAREAMLQFKNNLVLGNLVYREYVNEFVKVGDTVRIRRPVKYLVSNGATRVEQDTEEANTSIVVDQRKHVSMSFSSQDLTLKIEQFSERYIQPAAMALANKVDRDIASQYIYIPNWVGTPGQKIDAFADFAKGPERMDEYGVPEPLNSALSPGDHWAMLGNLTGLQIERPAEAAYRRGDLGMVAGIMTAMDQNVRTHTVGVATGTPLTNGVGQQVTYANANRVTWSQSLITDGWTNSTTDILLAGDVFTIAGVWAVNPTPGEGAVGAANKDRADFLREFTVLADADSGATTGPATLTISPPIILVGPQQTCDVDGGTVPDGAAITVRGTGGTKYKQNLVFAKPAIALAMVPLEMPRAAGYKARVTEDGFSIRIVEDYDIDNDVSPLRMDILYGIKTVDPDRAARVSGTA